MGRQTGRQADEQAHRQSGKQLSKQMSRKMGRPTGRAVQTLHCRGTETSPRGNGALESNRWPGETMMREDYEGNAKRMEHT